MTIGFLFQSEYRYCWGIKNSCTHGWTDLPLNSVFICFCCVVICKSGSSVMIPDSWSLPTGASGFTRCLRHWKRDVLKGSTWRPPTSQINRCSAVRNLLPRLMHAFSTGDLGIGEVQEVVMFLKGTFIWNLAMTNMWQKDTCKWTDSTTMVDLKQNLSQLERRAMPYVIIIHGNFRHHRHIIYSIVLCK